MFLPPPPPPETPNRGYPGQTLLFGKRRGGGGGGRRGGGGGGGGVDRNDEGNSNFSQYANSPNNRTSKHLLVSVVNTLLKEVELGAWVPFPVRRVRFFFLRNMIHQHPVQQVSGARRGGGGGGGMVYWRVKLILCIADITNKAPGPWNCTSKPQRVVMTSCVAARKYRPSAIHAIATPKKVRHKSGFSTQMVKCLSICQGAQLKSRVERTETWSTAADRPAARHRPAVFFGHVRLVALSLPQGKIDFHFKNMCCLSF